MNFISRHMESSKIYQEAKNLIEKSSNILLVAHAKMDGDTLSSALAMHLLLQKLEKKTQVVCADAVPETYAFLPDTKALSREIQGGSDFVIQLDCSTTSAKKLRWKTEDDMLKIIVTPNQGKFIPSQVSFSEENSFDLIISLDVADKKQFGTLYTEHTELFTSVPMIVFDHHASNEGFGTVNIIDPSSASTTEVLFHFLPTLLGDEWQKKIDPDIATLLLAGIITDTGSFQNPNTTPKSMEVAADLVDLGARQQEIIRNVFKTKNISTLKLWGRVLSKIETDPVHRMLWSTVSVDDLQDTDASTADTEGIIDELLATAPGMEMVLLVKEREDGITAVSIRTTTPLCDAAEFSGEFGGGGHTQAAGFKIRTQKPFEVIVGEVISAAQQFQSKRLRLDDLQISYNKEEKEALPEAKSKSIDVLGAIKKIDRPKGAESDKPEEIRLEGGEKPVEKKVEKKEEQKTEAVTREAPQKEEVPEWLEGLDEMKEEASDEKETEPAKREITTEEHPQETPNVEEAKTPVAPPEKQVGEKKESTSPSAPETQTPIIPVEEEPMKTEQKTGSVHEEKIASPAKKVPEAKEESVSPEAPIAQKQVVPAPQTSDDEEEEEQKEVVPELDHEEFSALLEKMMDVDPKKHTENHVPDQHSPKN